MLDDENRWILGVGCENIVPSSVVIVWKLFVFWSFELGFTRWSVGLECQIEG